LLTLSVGDDVNAANDKIEKITLRLGLLDPAAGDLPAANRHEGVMGSRRHKEIPKLVTAKGIESLIEVRVNNLLLDSPRIEEGWLVFPVDPPQLALGENLIGVRNVKPRPESSTSIIIEKLEVHVDYR